jgi:cytosine/adenosine deaminase-related metal-dependent hydrolase
MWGYLAPQMAADLIAYRLDQVEFAGALHDPVTALLFCRSVNVDLSIINGEVVVKDGQLTVLTCLASLKIITACLLRSFVVKHEVYTGGNGGCHFE